VANQSATAAGSDGDPGDANSETADPNDAGTPEQYAIAGANDFTVAGGRSDDNAEAP